MSKSIATRGKHERVDTTDHVMDRFEIALAWADQHRKIAVGALVALVVGVAGIMYYQSYQTRIAESAAQQLSQLRLGAQGAESPDAMRAALQTFVAQYGGTRFGDEARIILGDLELRRDSIDRAIAVLAPIASGSMERPETFNAAQMVASAYEQKGDVDGALDWYGRLESGARFDYQRLWALGEQARVLADAGRYGRSVEAYEALIELTSDLSTAENAEVFKVRLGEVKALQKTEAASEG
jgi:predicted negative regulator of RcsB-dependent stress response